jgi:hypothetical protein
MQDLKKKIIGKNQYLKTNMENNHVFNAPFKYMIEKVINGFILFDVFFTLMNIIFYLNSIILSFKYHYTFINFKYYLLHHEC